MIDFLLRVSLQRRGLVLALAGLMTALGLARLDAMPIDVFPDLTAPRVTVVTESTGMAPAEVEQLITFPIETAVNGLSGLRRVRSASAAGISIVWAEFDWNTDDVVARQRVTERLQGLTNLPPEVHPPALTPPSSVMGEIAFVALTGGDNPTQLRRVADIEVRRRLLAVPGVSQVVVIGGLKRQYQVRAKAQALRRYDLTIEQLIEAIERGNRNAPGGFVIGQGQESVVQVLGRAHSVEELAAITVANRDGLAVRVGDLAHVELGSALPRGAASYNASSAVMLSVVKQEGTDTIEVTEAIDRALDTIAPGLEAQKIGLQRDLFRQADFIDRAVSNLMVVLRDGALLVIAVLFIFLWSFRPTIISVLALPLSLLLSVIALDLLGLSLDTMTLGGLAIAIGELVDDAIVDVENVVRRLRERVQLPPDQRPAVLNTVLEASREIRSAIVSATSILMVVFLPLLFLEGLEGRLLRPLGIAYLVAIASSLLVAVTLTPVLCFFLLPKSVEGSDEEPPTIRWLQRAYEPTLRLALKRPLLMVAAAALTAVLGLIGLAQTGRSFLPEFNEGSLTVGAITMPGTSLAQADTLGAMAERALLADPAVVSTGRRTGRAEKDEHVQGVEAGEIEVRLRPDRRSKGELLRDLRRRLKAVPGMQFTIGQPISHRIDHMISGQRSALAIKLIGNDLDALRAHAEAVAAVARRVPGLVDVNVEQSINVPQVTVRIDRHEAGRYGLSAGQASAAAGTALWGQTASRIFEQGTVTDVVVRFTGGGDLDSIEAVRNTVVPTPSGAAVPLSAFAQIIEDRGPNYILRENVERRLVITANLAGGDQQGAVAALRQAVDRSVQLPKEIRIEYAGQFERQQAASAKLLLFGLLAMIGIVMILVGTLRSARRAAIVLVNLPLALAGGVIGVFIGGGTLSIASVIGFITLFGIATRNGVLLATRSRDLELEGLPRDEAVAQGARERLAPILMTAVTAGLGLLPLAMALGQPGSEIQAPMALVILTGLISSTALNMAVVPALIAHWGGESRESEPG